MSRGIVDGIAKLENFDFAVNDIFTAQMINDGEVIIGSGSGNPAIATLTAGNNVNILNASNSITISTSGNPGFTWNEVVGTSQTLEIGNAYITQNVSLTTLTLPASCSVGDQILITCVGSGLFTVAQLAGQWIRIGNQVSSTGAGGSVTALSQGDTLELVCTVTDLTFQAIRREANFTIV